MCPSIHRRSRVTAELALAESREPEAAAERAQMVPVRMQPRSVRQAAWGVPQELVASRAVAALAAQAGAAVRSAVAVVLA